jgi:hypothetical protein
VSAMDGIGWRQVPVGLDAGRWITRTDCKTVLIVAHTVTLGQRLVGILPLFESDRRVQVVFTAVPDPFANGVARLLRRLDGIVIPWEQATRTEFDLALAAGHASLHELHAPVIVMPHGAGRNKLVLRQDGSGSIAASGVYGLEAQNLVRGGRVVPAAIVLSHRAELAVLSRQCPEALPAAEVIGDPCHDQLAVSRPLRAAYREALGVPEEARLVVTASTWGTKSLFGQLADLHDRMLSELPPDQYRVVALMHPNVWYGQGPRQVRAWLGSAMRRGLALVPPDSEWLGALVASDVVIGDHGSTAVYSAAAGVPVVLGTFPDEDVVPGSAAALLAASAPRLQLDCPIVQQLDEAVTQHRMELSGSVAARITSEPGRFHRNMRRLIYQMLGLSQPSSIPVAIPAGIPTIVRRGDLRWRGSWSSVSPASICQRESASFRWSTRRAQRRTGCGQGLLVQQLTSPRS